MKLVVRVFCVDVVIFVWSYGVFSRIRVYLRLVCYVVFNFVCYGYESLFNVCCIFC